MRLNIPPVIRILLIINVIAFFAQQAVPGLTEWGALHYWRSPLFKPHQIITHMFLHGNFTHILFNMIALYFFGGMLENFWGAKRFLNFYLICGLGAALVQMIMIPWEVTRSVQAMTDIPAEYLNDAVQQSINQYSMIGASGAIMGVMAAFAWLFPNTEIYIYFAIPIKAKYLIPVYVLADLFGGFSRQPGDNVGHFAHLGGALVGILIVIFMNRTNRRNFY
jgi:membrane associated rhomboid family serine protease